MPEFRAYDTLLESKMSNNRCVEHLLCVTTGSPGWPNFQIPIVGVDDRRLHLDNRIVVDQHLKRSGTTQSTACYRPRCHTQSNVHSVAWCTASSWDSFYPQVLGPGFPREPGAQPRSNDTLG